MQNEHWNGPKIKKLYFWSWSCQVVLGNLLFSELFNREYFLPAFRIYLYFCQKHTSKSRKFNVLPNFTCGKESCLFCWRAIYRESTLPILSYQEGHTGSITFRNWECLYYDWSRDIRLNIAWALRKSLGLRPRDFPWAQAIFHRISVLSS